MDSLPPSLPLLCTCATVCNSPSHLLPPSLLQLEELTPLPSLPSLFSLIHSLFAHPHVKNTRYQKKKKPKKDKTKKHKQSSSPCENTGGDTTTEPLTFYLTRFNFNFHYVHYLSDLFYKQTGEILKVNGHHVIWTVDTSLLHNIPV